jgi:hypothetical protein
VIHEDEAPEALERLAREGHIQIDRAHVPLYARIVDDQVVQIKAEPAEVATPGISPKGLWLRTEQAEPALRAYVERSASLSEDSDNHPPESAVPAVTLDIV